MKWLFLIIIKKSLWLQCHAIDMLNDISMVIQCAVGFSFKLHEKRVINSSGEINPMTSEDGIWEEALAATI